MTYEKNKISAINQQIAQLEEEKNLLYMKCLFNNLNKYMEITNIDTLSIFKNRLNGLCFYENKPIVDSFSSYGINMPVGWYALHNLTSLTDNNKFKMTKQSSLDNFLSNCFPEQYVFTFRRNEMENSLPEKTNTRKHKI